MLCLKIATQKLVQHDFVSVHYIKLEFSSVRF